MTDKGRILTHRKRRRGFSTLPPFDLQHVAPLLIGVGFVLSIAAWTDVVLSYWPSRFGYTELEFGTIAQSFDAMPLPTLGLGLLAIGVLARGGSIVWSRALSVVFAAIGLACAVAMLVFALDVPVALKAAERAAAAPRPGALVSAGLKRIVAKALLFSLSYTVVYLWLATRMWRAALEARRRSLIEAHPVTLGHADADTRVTNRVGSWRMRDRADV